MKERKINNKELYDRLGVILFILLSTLALIILPYFFVTYGSWYTLQTPEANQLGGAIGGITAPITGVIIAFVTYLAFYAQIKANRQIAHDMKIGRIETQFYQMLELHRENVKNFRFIDAKNSTQLKGRQAFEKLRNMVNEYYDNESTGSVHKKMSKAYSNVFEGSEKCLGHSVEIAHYVRQLYQTVKYIAHNPYLEPSQKHNYLRQLRSQMSTDEQIMLFYNWLSGYGRQWQNEKNDFLIEYRMIHNIFPDRIPKEVVDFIKKCQKKFDINTNKQGSSIFEFQDWEDNSQKNNKK